MKTLQKLVVAASLCSLVSTELSAQETVEPDLDLAETATSIAPPSCDDDWSANLAARSPQLLAEVLVVSNFVEQARAFESSGLGRMFCPPSSDSPAGASELFSTGEEAGQFYCNNPDEIQLQSLPDTFECNRAAQELRETGIGSVKLGIAPNTDTQISVIAGVLNNRTAVIDGSFWGTVGEIVKAIIVGEAIDETKEVIQAIKDDQGERNRNHNVAEAEEHHRQAEESSEQAKETLREIREASEAAENLSEAQKLVQEEILSSMERAAEEAAEWEEKTRGVVDDVRNGVCTSIYDCDYIPRRNDCLDEVCIHAALEGRFSQARERIAQCEAQVEPFFQVQPELTEVSRLSEKLYNGCQTILVEDSCLAAGSEEPCDGSFDSDGPLDLEEKVRATFIETVTRGGNNPCSPDNLECNIAVNLEAGNPLSDAEQLYANASCGVDFQLEYEVPTFEPTRSVDDQCVTIGGRTVCDEEAACLRFIWSNPRINSFNYKFHMFSRYQCLNYASVTQIIEGRGFFYVDDVGTSFLNETEEQAWWDERMEETPNLLEDFLGNRDEVNVTKAGALEEVLTVGDPFMNLVLGKNDDGVSFNSYVCERL